MRTRKGCRAATLFCSHMVKVVRGHCPRHGARESGRASAAPNTKAQAAKRLSKKKIFDECGGTQNEHDDNEQQKCGQFPVPDDIGVVQCHLRRSQIVSGPAPSRQRVIIPRLMSMREVLMV